MKYHILLLLGAFLIFFTNDELIAQADEEKDLSYKIGLRVSGSRISGTFTQNTLQLGLETNFDHKKWELHNSLSYRFNRTNGLAIEDNWYDLLTFAYYPNEQKLWFPAAFYHYDNNLIFRVNRRHRFGAGIGTIPVDNAKAYLRIVITGGYEDTHYNGSDFVNSDLDMPIRQNGLFMVYLNNNYTLVENRLLFKLRIFYMQSLKERADYDLWFTPSLAYKVNKYLSFSINYDYRFENVHLEPIGPANDVLLFGMNVNLGS